MPSQRARVLLAQGDIHAAARWTTAAGLSPDDEPDYPREPGYLVLARVLLAENDPGPALALLQRLADAATSQGRVGSIIEIGALRALALAAAGDHASAVNALTEAVTLARPQGYVRIFADEGAPMRHLLTQLCAARPGQPHPGDRQLEVLRLIAAGSSNQRIAHDLVVALDTIKKHVTHVLGKLGAANRTEAVARARQLGLIP